MSSAGQTGQEVAAGRAGRVQWEPRPIPEGGVERLPPVVDAVPRRISASGAGTCAVLEERLFCWGDNLAETVEVELAGPVEEVALGGRHACARVVDGGVWCWGDNRFGQLGDGTLGPSHTPVQVLLSEPVLQVIAGEDHSCAVLEDGTAACWGRNTEGQLGDGRFVSRSHPAPVVGLTSVVHLAASADQTIARQADGALLRWGAGEWVRQWVGRWPGEASAVTVPESRFPDAMAFQIQHHGICLLSVLGVLSCGELAPVAQVPSLEGSVDLQGGEVMDFHYMQRHRCVLSRQGRVRCWGDNIRGQLGDGTRERRDEPQLVAGLEDVVGLAAGYEHSCALVESGEVFCWGRNDKGQLGDGTTTDRLVPVRVVR